MSKMAKIQLTVVKDAYQSVIDVLHELGVVEIEQAEAPENKLYKPESKADYWQTNVKFALDLLKEFEGPVKKSLAEKFASSKQEVTPSQIKELEHEFNYKALISELENLDKKLNTYKNTISQHRKEQKTLKEWRGLPEVCSRENRFSKFAIGTIPAARFEDFLSKAAEIKLFDVIKVSESEREMRIATISAHDSDEEISKILEQFEFKSVYLGLEDTSIEVRIKELETEVAENKQKLEAVETKIKQYVIHIPKFEILFDYLTWHKEQDEASKKALATKSTVSLLGWAPTHVLPDVTKRIDEQTKDYILEELEIGEEERIPVVLRNSSVITPFESVTEIYGAPLTSEPDPTLLLAPFFIVYFAFCLSDAMYGFMLAGFAYLALRIMKPKGMSRKLMQLMIFCGIATVIAGAIFGGWFGLDLAIIPGPVGNALRSMQILNPVSDPMTVLLVAFVLGFVQLVAGNMIDMIWKIRQGLTMDGLLGGGIWGLFLLVIGFWILIKAAVLPASLSSIANYAMIAMAVAMVLTQGREQKNIFAKLGSGVASLYGLVGYLSDLLSYSRLLALGLSTGIIAMVVNLVANLFGSMIPYVGPIVFVLILVVGHIFNLIISALGAFIHSGRLQYVEYFPKFLVGGGRKFKPFVKTSKYITLNNN